MSENIATPDLFNWTPPPSYPDAPGHRHVDTSIEAAAEIANRAHTLREECMDMIKASPDGLTADQVAARLGESVLSIRPRITELKKTGRIVDSGRRRKNHSGRRAAVMVAA